MTYLEGGAGEWTDHQGVRRAILPDSTALGKGPMPANREGLEVIELDGYGDVRFRSTELLAQCPLTGQPDLYQVELVLEDMPRTLESKSLKLYLWSWAGVGIFAEDLARAILRDTSRALGTEGTITVELVQSIRGGITTTVRASSAA